MEIVKHIKDLLYHHDCVVVPGFGGFVTNERSAHIDRAANSFHPPAREVGFNARLDHNDGLLISYLSARLSLNYVDARSLVEKFAADVNRKIKEGRVVNFDGIGQFSVTRQGSLQFDPDPSANFLTDAYGLSFFRCPALETTRKSKKERRKADPAGERRIMPRTRRLLKYAAVGIPLIAALTWGAMNSDVMREFSFDLSSINPFSAVVDSGIRQVPADGEGIIDTGPVEEPAAAVTTQRNALMYEEPARDAIDAAAGPEFAPPADEVASRDAVYEAEARPAPAETVSPPETSPARTEATPSPAAASQALAEATRPAVETTRPAVETTRPSVETTRPATNGRTHHLVAGSFRNRQNALTLSEKFSHDGYRTEVLDAGNGLYRVSVYSTANPDEALVMMRQLRRIGGLEDVWMLSR
ncbi:MAG: hypothetical protein EA408_08045 [Marinilabiliales bacterium]|nr:MAG: hypothetical protein EA408_08045 [Marinilabiliales bacterium]